MLLQELLVKISADVSEYTSGIAEAVGQASELESAFSSLGVGLSAAVTGPLVAIGAAALDAAANIKEAYNAIIVGTGAVGDNLESLKGSFAAVFAEVPASAKEVGGAIAFINNALDLTGAPLEQLTAQLAKLSEVTGTSLMENVRSLVPIFNQWQVATQDQAQTLNYLWGIAQHTNTSMLQLGQGLTAYGANFRNMGVDLEGTAAIIGELSKLGIPAERVMAGLAKAVSNMSKAGVDTSDGFRQVIDYIKMASTEAEGLKRTLDIFGAKGGGQIFQAIKLGGLDVDPLTAQMKSYNASIAETQEKTKTFTTVLKEEWNKLQLGLAPLGTSMTNTLKDALLAFDPLIAAIGRLGTAFASQPESYKTIELGIVGIAAAAGPAILALEKLNAWVISPAIAALSSTLGPGGMIGEWMAGTVSLSGTAVALTAALAALALAFAGLAFDVGGAATKLGGWLDNQGINLFEILKGAALGKSPAEIAAASAEASAKTLGDRATDKQAAALANAYGNALQPGSDAANAAADTPEGKAAAANAVAIAKAREAAKKAAKELEEALSVFGLKSQEELVKFPAALEKIGAAFDHGALSAQRYGLAIEGAIAKELSEAEKLSKSSFAVELSGAETKGFQKDLAGLNTDLAAGRVSLKQYVEALKDLQDRFAAATGTSRQNALKHLGIPSHEDLQEAYADAQRYYAQIVADANHTAQEENLAFEKKQAAGQQVDPRLIAYARVGVTPQEVLQHSAQVAQGDLDKVWNDAGATTAQKFATFQKTYSAIAATDPTNNALLRLNIPSRTQLEEGAKAAQADLDQVMNDAATSIAQKFATFEKTYSAIAAADPTKSVLLRLGIPDRTQLEQHAKAAQADLDQVMNDAATSIAQKFATFQKTYNDIAAADPTDSALLRVGIASRKQLEQGARAAQADLDQVMNDARTSIAQKFATFQKTYETIAAADPTKSALLRLGIPDRTQLEQHAKAAEADLDQVMNDAAVTIAQKFATFQKTYNDIAAADPTKSALLRLGVSSHTQLTEEDKAAQADVNTVLNDPRSTSDEKYAAIQAASAKKQAADPRLYALQRLGVPAQTDLNEAAKEAADYYNRIAGSAKSTTLEIGQAWYAMIDKQIAADQRLSAETIAAYVAIRGNANSQMLDFGKAIEGQVETAFSGMSKAIATNLVTWKGWKDSVLNIAKEFAVGFLDIFIKQALLPLEKEAAKLAVTLGTKLGSGLGLFGAAGKAGVDAAVGAAPAAAMQAGDAAIHSAVDAATGAGVDAATGAGVDAATGAATNAAGQAATKAVSSSLMATVGAISSAVTAVTGVIGVFQTMHMETALKAIVEHTLRIFNETFNRRKDAWDQHIGLMAKLDDIWKTVGEGLGNLFTRLGEVSTALANGITVNAGGAVPESPPAATTSPTPTPEEDAVAKAQKDADQAKIDAAKSEYDAAMAAKAASDKAMADAQAAADAAAAAVPNPATTPPVAGFGGGNPAAAPVGFASGTPLPENQSTVNMLTVLNQTCGEGLSAILAQLQRMTGFGGTGTGAGGGGTGAGSFAQPSSVPYQPGTYGGGPSAGEIAANDSKNSVMAALASTTVEEFFADLKSLPDAAQSVVEQATANIDRTAPGALDKLKNGLGMFAQMAIDAAAGVTTGMGGAAAAAGETSRNLASLSKVLDGVVAWNPDGSIAFGSAPVTHLDPVKGPPVGISRLDGVAAWNPDGSIAFGSGPATHLDPTKGPDFGLTREGPINPTTGLPYVYGNTPYIPSSIDVSRYNNTPDTIYPKASDLAPTVSVHIHDNTFHSREDAAYMAQLIINQLN